MIHILIASGHSIVRGALTQVVSAHPDMAVTAEFPLELAVTPDSRNWSPADLMLFDVTMPGTDAIALIHWLSTQKPGLPVLVLSALNGSAVVPTMLRMGARGCIARESDPPVLFEAIREIAAGRKFIDPALVNAFFFGDAWAEQLPEGLLSTREYQVLQMIASGRKVSDIARSFSLSVKTVSTHKTRLMRKLNVENNADLMRYALRHGFTTTP